jgi:hypothetical protein
MPSFGYTAGRRSTPPTIEYQSSGLLTRTIPAGAKGFKYVLCAPGGGGGGGRFGLGCGGGGGGSGEFVDGVILIGELIEVLGGAASDITLRIDLGIAGAGGNVQVDPLANGNPGDRGSDAFLNASTVNQSIILATAKGGFGGLGGTKTIGYGHGEVGTTYTASGGIGERAIKNEARFTRNRDVIDLNHYGDGGNGGDREAAGSPGLPGYFFPEFF